MILLSIPYVSTVCSSPLFLWDNQLTNIYNKVGKRLHERVSNQFDDLLDRFTKYFDERRQLDSSVTAVFNATKPYYSENLLYEQSDVSVWYTGEMLCVWVYYIKQFYASQDFKFFCLNYDYYLASLPEIDYFPLRKSIVWLSWFHEQSNLLLLYALIVIYITNVIMVPLNWFY